MDGLSIGKVARGAGVPIDTVRYYEREGLLEKPVRTSSGYRQYPPDAVARLQFIRQAKDLGFTLSEIRELLGPDIEIQIVHRDVGLEAPTHGPLVDAVTTALRAHDPEAEVFPYLLSGGTDNKSLSRLGIAGYGFAPLRLPATIDFPSMFHGVDERVPLDALVFGRQVLRDLLLAY